MPPLAAGIEDPLFQVFYVRENVWLMINEMFVGDSVKEQTHLLLLFQMFSMRGSSKCLFDAQ